MPIDQRQAGVTLIELLVVITIMMSVLGLIGGATIESVDRAKAQTEVISVYSLFKKSSVQAFASGNVISLKFKGPEVTIFVENEQRSQKQFQHLVFEDQAVSFNRNGLPNNLMIVVNARGVPRQLDLHSIFDNFVAIGSSQLEAANE